MLSRADYMDVAVPPTGIVLNSDEENFQFSAALDKSNFPKWAAEIPRELRARPLHNQKVTNYCTVPSSGIIGT